MSILDGLLGQVQENLNINDLAARFGIDPAMAQSAVAALAGAHPQPGDTVATAAAQTGLDSGVLGQIAAHLGGEGGLGQISQLIQSHPEGANLLGMLGGNGEAGGLLGAAKGLFG